MKLTVILWERQTAWLDSLGLSIRMKHRVSLSRNTIIAAIVEAAERAGV